MTIEEKLDLLMSLAVDDHEGVAGNVNILPPRLRHIKEAGALRPLNLRDVRVGSTDRRATLLRILMTNACSFNCHYCPMRRDRGMARTLLKPEELVRIFLAAYQRGWCSGLFLTTGIPGRPVHVMDDLITVLELLRERHAFRGYIHVKIIPGADDAQIERITALASRVSVNLETPCGESLSAIAPDKRFETSLVTLQRAQTRVSTAQHEERDGRPRDPFRPGGTAGMTMQFVVGASNDSDRSIVERVTGLYAGGGIHHTQFSAFRPIRDTPLESANATPAVRELRLYQTDHLIRRYGFARDEIVFDDRGNLPLERDPKVAWALAHPERFPVDVRTGSYSQLLRVPGIGPQLARRIVTLRRSTIFRSAHDLRALGVILGRAAGFLSLNRRLLGRERWTEQLGLWAPQEEAGAYRRTFEFSPGTFR
jgi:predicted DNA-binding helix-hairpin-helix protein